MAEQSRNLSEYRFGFNGQEADNEVYWAKQSYSFEFRNYDSRLERWWRVDRIQSNYPNLSPYSFSLNNPIRYFDENGKWVRYQDGNIIFTHFEIFLNQTIVNIKRRIQKVPILAKPSQSDFF